MSNSLVRELFRNLQTSIQERLSVLEELIERSPEPQSHGTIEQSLHITRMDPALQERLNTMDTTLRELFTIQKTLADSVKENKARDKELQSTLVRFDDRMKDTDCRVVGALDQLDDISRHLLSLEARMKVLEARVTVAEPAVEEVQGDIVKEEEEDAPVIAEAEAADVEDDEEAEEEGDADDEEDADEEDEEEGGGLEGEEFEYKGDTYFRDTSNKVYIPDEDGAVDPDSPVGLWVPNPKLKEGGKITRLT